MGWLDGSGMDTGRFNEKFLLAVSEGEMPYACFLQTLELHPHLLELD